MKKRISAAVMAAVLTLALCSCAAPARVGTSAPEITVDRGTYLSLKNGTTEHQDVSSVVAYIRTLEDVVGDIGDYELSYDSDSNTVYATTEDANIAFYLDDNGYIKFTAFNGDYETRQTLNQGMMQASIAACVADGIDGILSEIEETHWLNTINGNVLTAVCNSYGFTDLDTTLLYVETPTLDMLSASDLEADLSDGLEMPVLTETLKASGVIDLTDYYEAPSLVKYWTSTDFSDIQDSITSIVSNGISLGETFASYKLDTTSLTLPEWSISSYSLPSTFSDGTSTSALGTQTLSTFNAYQSSLDTWCETLVQNELNAQASGLASVSANSIGIQSASDIQSIISANSSALSTAQSSNFAWASGLTGSAMSSVSSAAQANQAAVDAASGSSSFDEETLAEYGWNGSSYSSILNIVNTVGELKQTDISMDENDYNYLVHQWLNRGMSQEEAEAYVTAAKESVLDPYYDTIMENADAIGLSEAVAEGIFNGVAPSLTVIPNKDDDDVQSQVEDVQQGQQDTEQQITGTTTTPSSSSSLLNPTDPNSVEWAYYKYLGGQYTIYGTTDLSAESTVLNDAGYAEWVLDDGTVVYGVLQPY